MRYGRQLVGMLSITCVLSGCSTKDTVSADQSNSTQISSELQESPQNEFVNEDGFIPDYREGQKNKNGNTLCNIKNGGWVVEQGDWNYYAYDGCISKENVVTGAFQILCNYGADDGEIRIDVCGDYIYWRFGGMFCRIRTDGAEYIEYPVDTLQAWAVYEEITYIVTEEHVSAQTYCSKVKKFDWENGEITEVCDLGSLSNKNKEREGRFLIGMEDGYLYLYDVNATKSEWKWGEIPEYKREYIQVNLSKSTPEKLAVEFSYEQTDEYAGMQDCIVCEQCMYFFGSGHMDIINCATMSVDPLKLEEKIDGEFTFVNLIGGSDIPMNFVGNMIVTCGNYQPQDGTNKYNYDDKIYGIENRITEISPDSTDGILVAHNKIYYRSYADGTYIRCRMNSDGSNWEQLQ